MQQVVRENWDREDAEEDGAASPTEAQSEAGGGWRRCLIQLMSHKKAQEYCT